MAKAYGRFGFGIDLTGGKCLVALCKTGAVRESTLTLTKEQGQLLIADLLLFCAEQVREMVTGDGQRQSV